MSEYCCDLECGERFFKNHPRCRHNRDVHASMASMSLPSEPKTVIHRYNVWVTVPAKSGDGWSKYPDFSQEEIGRAIRRALHAGLEVEATVEFAETGGGE